jgi:hypothetical protein
VATSTLLLGSFTWRKARHGTYGFTSPPKEGLLRIFRPKNPTASAGFEPANLGTKGQHATSRPPKPITMRGHTILKKKSGKQRDCQPEVAIPRLGSRMRLAQVASKTNIQVVLLLHRAFRRFNHFHTPTYALIYILSITKTLCSFDRSYMFRHTACQHQGSPLSWLKSLVKNIRS